MTIKFSDIEDDIKKALNSKEILFNENLYLCDGFFPQMKTNEIDEHPLDLVPLHRSYIQTIICVGKKSGRVYQFALKSILPNIDIENKK